MLINVKVTTDVPSERHRYYASILEGLNGSRHIISASTSLAASIIAEEAAREIRAEPGTIGLILAEEPTDKTKPNSMLTISTTEIVINNLVGSSTSLSLAKNEVCIIHCPLLEGDDRFLQVLPLARIYQRQVNPLIDLRIDCVSVFAFHIAQFYSSRNLNNNSEDDRWSKERWMEYKVCQFPDLKTEDIHEDDLEPFARLVRTQEDNKWYNKRPRDSPDFVDLYMKERRLKAREEREKPTSEPAAEVPSRPEVIVIEPEDDEERGETSSDQILTDIYRQNVPVKFRWDQNRTRIGMIQEYRAIDLCTSDYGLGNSSDTIRDLIQVIRMTLSDSEGSSSSSDILMICRSESQAFTLRNELSRLSRDNPRSLSERRPISISCVTRSSNLQAKIKFFLRKRSFRPSPTRFLCVTDHSLIMEVPATFPQSYGIIIDEGLMNLDLPWLWNNSVSHSFPTPITALDIIMRASALAGAPRTQYITCCRFNEISMKPRGFFSSIDIRQFLPTLLHSIMVSADGDQPWDDWLLPPWIPSLGQALTLLERLRCLNEEKLDHERCEEFLKWLKICKGEPLLAGLMLMSRLPEFNCFIEAASIVAMLLYAPQPFGNETIYKGRQHKLQLETYKSSFAVVEGDLLTLSRIMYEVGRHDDVWAKANGLVRVAEIREAIEFAQELLDEVNYEHTCVARNNLENHLLACITLVFYENILYLRGLEEYHAIDRREIPSFVHGSRKKRGTQYVYAVSPESTLHLRPSLPDTIIFWKGISLPEPNAIDIDEWPINVSYCCVADFSAIKVKMPER